MKELIGYFSVAAALVSYFFYFASMLKGRTKPHAFSWATWGILTAIAFYAQYTNKAGPGAWGTGFIAAACFVVAGMALFWGEKRITRSDWIMFSCALVVLPAWYFTDNPLVAVILIVVIDALGGYYPTFRKSYHKPYEEMLLLYVIGVFQLILSLFAMESYNVVNILYPLFVIAANSSFILMVMWRRKHADRL